MSHGKMVAKTTSRGGESMGSGALPNCLYFRFFSPEWRRYVPLVQVFCSHSCSPFSKLNSIHHADIASYSKNQPHDSGRASQMNYYQ